MSIVGTTYRHIKRARQEIRALFSSAGHFSKSTERKESSCYNKKVKKTLFLLPLLLLTTCQGGQSSPEPLPGLAASPTPTEELRQQRLEENSSVAPSRDSVSETKKVYRGLRLQKIGSFSEPVWVEEGPGAIFIVQKGGQIIRKDSFSQKTWLDISDRVRNSGEAGLLGMAFGPGQSGKFYLYYTDNSGDQVVSEGLIRPRPRLVREVLRMSDPAENHNGGQISFGPGGLYIATGDGGGSGDPERAAQNTRSLLGKILRIDPLSKKPYAIPQDNPFARGGGRPEIFSLGLRNPWRFSFGAGRLWVADVGQDRQEEISAPRLARARGGNFGWSAWEGRERFNEDQQAENPIWPVLVYGRDRGCSVTGGYWIERLGDLRRRYLYGDFCTGEIRSFRLRGGRAVGDRSENIEVASLASFARSGSGKTWAVSLGGPVYRILPG